MHFKQSSNVETSFELNIELHAQLNTQQTILTYKTKNTSKQENIAIPCRVFRAGLSGLRSNNKILERRTKINIFEISKI
jgi:hypothetical protein